MNLLHLLGFGQPQPASGGDVGGRPRASGDAGMILDLQNPEHVKYLREGGAMTASGRAVGIEGAMRVGVANRCTNIIAGACGNMPIGVFLKSAEGKREPQPDHTVSRLLKKPNSWQTGQEFKKMLTAHKLLRGNGYALKITSRGKILELWPMHPDRVEPEQLDDMSLRYKYTTKQGRVVYLAQDEVLHLRGLTLDGVKGLGVIQYAREALGLSLQTEAAGARLFKQGVIAPGALKHPASLSDEAYARLKQSIDENNAGAENAHKWLILEEGMDVAQMAMTAEDAQFLSTRDFQRTDVGMFYGVPPHLYGAVDKSTSWGTGIEQQNTGFIQYTLDDHFVCWEESCQRDLLTQADRDLGLFIRLERKALLRGDLKARTAHYTAMLQWGVYNPDKVLELEDENPRSDGQGGVYYDPPNTAGGTGKTPPDDDDETDPKEPPP